MPAAVRAGKERDCPLRTSTLCSENWASGGALGLAPEISNLLGTKTFLLQDALQHLNLPGSCGGSVPWEGWSYAKTWEIPGRAA